MQVGVTGAAGELGTEVVRQLLASGDRVVSIDVRPPRVEGTRWISCDVRSPTLSKHLTGCDALIHLAYIVEPSHDKSRDMEINVDGTKNVARCARAAGVEHLVFASSISAYGYQPDNIGRVFDETAPLRAGPEFAYAYSKRLAENWLDAFERESSKPLVTRVRPCLFAGPHSNKQVFGSLQSSRLLVTSREYDLPVQFAHVEDVARLFVMVTHQRAGGAFNVAVEGTLSPSKMALGSGMRAVRLQKAVIDVAVEILWRTRLLKMSPDWIRVGMRWPVIVSTDRARRVLGWKPRLDSSRLVARELFVGP